MKKYIIFDNNSKKVKDIFDKEPKFVNKLPTTMVAEYEGEIPQGDYLTVVNPREETDTWIEKETVEKTNEKGEIVYEEVEVEKSRTYLTCDLVANFIQLTEEQIAEQKQKRYESLCQQYIRERYSPTDENKVVREYLADMYNLDKKAQFDEYNTYVESCKIKAKTEVYGGGK